MKWIGGVDQTYLSHGNSHKRQDSKSGTHLVNDRSRVIKFGSESGFVLQVRDLFDGLECVAWMMKMKGEKSRTRVIINERKEEGEHATVDEETVVEGRKRDFWDLNSNLPSR